eukprot:365478-Chlamydomonas_euryale.AAC.8
MAERHERKPLSAQPSAVCPEPGVLDCSAAPQPSSCSTQPECPPKAATMSAVRPRPSDAATCAAVSCCRSCAAQPAWPFWAATISAVVPSLVCANTCMEVGEALRSVHAVYITNSTARNSDAWHVLTNIV